MNYYFRLTSLFGFTVLLCLLLSCQGADNDKHGEMPEIEKSVFGHMPDGKEVHIFTLKNPAGITVEITNYGGIITSLLIPGRNGEFEDVVLGFDNLDDYLGSHPYIGTLVGRYANRISNAYFELDGTGYQLAANNRGNHLHGGIESFDRKLWDYNISSDDDVVSLKLTYVSPDGEEGYPGNLAVEVIYSLNNSNELTINYKAITDKATPLNMTHHGYFNFTGGSESILGHELMVNSNYYLEVNHESIPTGNILNVEGTALDFRNMKPVGRDIADVGTGYDHCYVLNENDGSLKMAAVLYEPISGRRMEVLTTQPGIQVFTGNSLGGNHIGKGGIVYENYWGICLETQHFPDSPNQPSFPNTILRPGEEYSHTVIHRFSAE